MKGFLSYIEGALRSKSFSSLLFITIIVSILQLGGIDAFAHPFCHIDMITPWLITLLIVHPPLVIFSFVGVATFLQEIHRVYPAGFYLTTYSIICLPVVLIKHQMSWRKPLTWVVVMGLATSVVTVLEEIIISQDNFEIIDYTTGPHVRLVTRLLFASFAARFFHSMTMRITS